MSPNEPNLPETLRGLDLAFVGSRARRALGLPGTHGPQEVVVRAPLETLRTRLPEATPHGRDALLAGDLHAHAAPDGLEAGLRRRGVHLDAIGVRPDGAVLDPLGGREALAQGRLSWTPPEDDVDRALVPLRVLASELGLTPTEAQLADLADASGTVLRADRDEVRVALTTLLLGRHPVPALEWLEQTHLLHLVLPEVAALVNLHRSSRFPHKDVWAHTCLVVRQALPRAHLRWAALLHDIGKPYTRSYAPPRQVHFFHHDELGAVMFEGIAARLRFPAALGERVRALILHHLRANLYLRSWTDAAVRRFGLDMGEVFDDLLHLSRADVTSRRPGRRREAIANLYDLGTRLRRLQREDAARAPCVPKGLGAAIIQTLGVPAGPTVGVLRRACEEAVRDGSLPPAVTIDECLRFLKARGAA